MTTNLSPKEEFEKLKIGYAFDHVLNRYTVTLKPADPYQTLLFFKEKS